MNLHHVGIAVADLSTAAQPYLQLGYVLEASGEVESQGVAIYMLQAPEQDAGRLELLSPSRPDSPIAKFLQKRGPGLHHLAFGCKEIATELRRLEAEGVPLIDITPRPGFGGHLVAFIHPKWAGGVLVELVEGH